jgi:hypothetical protein
MPLNANDDFEHVKKRSFVDHCHALMRFDTHHLRQHCLVDTPAVTMNFTLVAGSGTRFERDDLLDNARF